jgi:hypothetical protein
MTPQQIETMKLALEALEGFYEYGYDRQECFEHITAIKEALAEHAMRETQRLGQEIEPDDIASILACRNMLDAQPVPPRTEQEPVANRSFLEKMLAAMEGVIDVADRKTDEFEALRSCVVDLTLMLYTPPQRTKENT